MKISAKHSNLATSEINHQLNFMMHLVDATSLIQCGNMVITKQGFLRLVLD